MESLENLLKTAKVEIGQDFKKEKLRCKKCKEALEKDVILFGKLKRVAVACSCTRVKEKNNKLEFEKRQRLQRLREIFREGLIDKKFKEATFKNWDRKLGEDKLYKICEKYGDKFFKVREDNLGLLIHGKAGSGKTYATAAIANKLIEDGIPVLAISINKLLERIKESYNTEGLSEDMILRALNMAELLIIDDLGVEQHTEWSENLIYKIVDGRYRANKPLIITTNLDIRDLEDVYNRRVIDRLIELCITVYSEGGSIREVKARDKMQKLGEVIN